MDTAEQFVIEALQVCSFKFIPKDLDSKKSQDILASLKEIKGRFIVHTSSGCSHVLSENTDCEQAQTYKHYEVCVGDVEHDCVPCSESLKR